MTKNELPEPWAKHLSSKGVHSYRDMAAKVGVSPETCRRLLTGGKTSSTTVNAVADALFDGDRTRVWALYGAPLKDYGPWELPAEASLLDPDQREAVLAVVRAMLPNRKGGDGNADADTGGPAPMKKPLSVVDVELPAAAKTGDVEESGEFNT